MKLSIAAALCLFLCTFGSEAFAQSDAATLSTSQWILDKLKRYRSTSSTMVSDCVFRFTSLPAGDVTDYARATGKDGRNVPANTVFEIDFSLVESSDISSHCVGLGCLVSDTGALTITVSSARKAFKETTTGRTISGDFEIALDHLRPKAHVNGNLWADRMETAFKQLAEECNPTSTDDARFD